MTPDKVEAALTALRHVAIAIEHGSTHRDDGTFIREALSVLTEAVAESRRDAARWCFYADSPQTALMLGSELDPNKPADWKAECDRIADAAMKETP